MRHHRTAPVVALLLAACGGGGSEDPAPAPAPAAVAGVQQNAAPAPIPVQPTAAPAPAPAADPAVSKMACVYEARSGGTLLERREYGSTFRWQQPVVFADGAELQSFATGQWAPVGTQQIDAATLRWLFVPPTHVISADVRAGRVVRFQSSGGRAGEAVATVCQEAG